MNDPPTTSIENPEIVTVLAGPYRDLLRRAADAIDRLLRYSETGLRNAPNECECDRELVAELRSEAGK